MADETKGRVVGSQGKRLRLMAAISEAKKAAN
jgi:hypothetical protein